MTTARGRGYLPHGRGRVDISQTSEPLRRPGEAGLQRRNIRVEPEEQANGKGDGDFNRLIQKLSDLELSNCGETALSSIAQTIKTSCCTSEDVNLTADHIYKFCLESKLNAHIGAILCKILGDFGVGNAKFKVIVMRKIQHDYQERAAKYNNLDKFLMNVTLLCEIFHHVRLPTGACFECLVSPIIDYFGMLVDGGTEKEILVFVEQIPKSCKELKLHQPDAFENLLTKMRKQIVSDSSTVSTKSSLLETFERILTDWTPLSQKASNFYELLTKQIVSICK